ncbi:hypothetical protein A2697_02870 [Candidatus Curtissbacteria bacterium RIFCSPHIGHO2_01_FULL_41_44]|uniref:Uncharacterized protein n=1 Tax=Candidatus Curtissbacteria bacterium RIFCSPLOWO2_01_FULL_42_50 TaxID=1797730 RepID=A0A1F5H7X0_9BACT|nr:MAG: hypothetical protein A2697_02870 [Candidatus Curtissbacteria bacterium RIFCSPHIGHO2_01_FULL_41_44]OGD93030.1 MAG: hypothetical protein A3C33_01050 [Candidatus Curtissbacteria bacterium RIFCSPHIGHO2_02_FULL_42_58]OGD97038.1 MAG: hypothetical protein A3E71_02340 [Candidatus Curtissbacteria bacterium RIFCSPHIGHO2_12_FULL_42_33]OGE00267.1 MAG: hypothetical protein A3B54_00815 [Candidatus Curtissbacteria bacterium RIFCSPLOWO2_01_FULL_42_50]OGE03063.1 MAG: hypothetical protein A3G16_04205 [Ca
MSPESPKSPPVLNIEQFAKSLGACGAKETLRRFQASDAALKAWEKAGRQAAAYLTQVQKAVEFDQQLAPFIGYFLGERLTIQTIQNDPPSYPQNDQRQRAWDLNLIKAATDELCQWHAQTIFECDGQLRDECLRLSSCAAEQIVQIAKYQTTPNQLNIKLSLLSINNQLTEIYQQSPFYRKFYGDIVGLTEGAKI